MLIDVVEQIDVLEKEQTTLELKLVENTDYRNPMVLKRILKWHDLDSEIRRLKLDLDSCNSKDPDDMCRTCNCWKHTRAMCS